MRRLIWVAVGAVGGVYAARQASAARQRLSPDHAASRAAARVGAASGATRQLVADVRAATRQRDAELRAALGIGDGGAATGADAQRVADLLGGRGPADAAYLTPPPTYPVPLPDATRRGRPADVTQPPAPGSPAAKPGPAHPDPTQPAGSAALQPRPAQLDPTRRHDQPAVPDRASGPR